METFEDYLDTIDNEDHRLRLTEIYDWVENEFPQLGKRIAWNQPMYTHEDTFIISFSTTKKHISVAPEKAALRQFSKEIEETGYDMSKELFKIKWAQAVNYDLLRDVISFNIEDKKGYENFWRK